MVNLTRREKKLGIGVTAVVVVWAVYGLAIEPAQDRIRLLERIIPQKQNELVEVQAKSAEYAALRSEFEDIQARIAQQDPAFELLPFLESLVERHRLGEHVVTMEQDPLQPQEGYAETSVTIDLKGVSLSQLVDFLNAIESSPVVAQVGSLHIRKDLTDEGTLASTMQIVSPRLMQTSGAGDSPRP
jgi:type II secretory pathway component PulM